MADATPATALVVGATGLSGSYAARRLKEAGWSVVTLSRRAEPPAVPDRHVAVDLTDRAAVAAALRDAGDVTHLFWCTWSMQPSEPENVRVNRAMIENVFAGLPEGELRHIGLVTGLKHYLGSFDSYGASKPETPFRETQPRLPGPNFYYDLEDVVFAEAARRGATWAVHRPHTMIGFCLGNAMNMGVTLAVTASICRATGRPFVFPGSPEQYDALADVTDARILADQLLWAATNPAAADLAFNVVNGDIFRWRWLWQEIAGYFGIDAADYPGHAQPLVDRMADADEIWSDIVRRHGLEPHRASEIASFWHTDADLGRTVECVTDMRNSRERGFASYVATPASFVAVFDELREKNIIPAA